MIRRDGCLKLMDFGIAQIIDHQKLTMTGQLLGSPAYMAPELISGRPVDARTDLFSVGIMLYQLATGMLPFSGRNPHEVLSKIADANYPPPSSICSMVDDGLEAIIDRALARDPDQRFQTADELAQDLCAYLAEADVPATQAEVMAYFQAHEEYTAELNERVCAALMERAAGSMRKNQSARAIRLLGRVLELDPDNAEAIALLGRLRRRERRIRTLAVLGAGAAGFGLVAAGVLLATSLPDDPKSMVGDENNPTLSAGKPLRTQPVVPNAIVTKPIKDGLAPSSPEETAGETARTTGGGGKRPIARPPKANPAVQKNATCTLTISGIPPAVARSYNLKYAGKKESITSLKHDISFSGDKVTVNLTGPRYYGYKTIAREACLAGPVQFPAQRKSAVLRFRGAPPNTTAECISGPPCPDAKPHLVGDGVSFPEIPMALDQVYIKLRFKSSGYAPKVERVSIQPGANQIDLDLKAHND